MSNLQWFIGKKREETFLLNSFPSEDEGLVVFSWDNTAVIESEEYWGNLRAGINSQTTLKDKFFDHYKFLIGPFKTEEGANYMLRHLKDCHSVHEAELCAKKEYKNYIHGIR